MTIRRLLPLLFLAAACRPDAAPRPDAPPRAAPGPAYLVWAGDSAGVARTVWLDAAGNEVASRPGAVIAAGNALWAWTEGKTTAKGLDCGCVNTPGEDSTEEIVARRCTVSAPVNTAAFVDLVSGRRSELMAAPDSSADEAVPEQRARPVAIVGPYLFTEIRAHLDMCGAHGFTDVEWEVYDLANGGRGAALLTPRDSAAVLAREGEKARAALQKDSFALPPVDTVTLIAIEPAWGADGALRVRYRFAARTCEACTDAFASSSSVSSSVPAEWVPPALARGSRAPEPVRRWWAAHPALARSGWSEVDPSRTAAFLARFRQP